MLTRASRFSGSSRRLTRAWAASWTATLRRSLGSARLGRSSPATVFRKAWATSSMPISSPFRRAASIAASLSRFSSDAPEKPTVIAASPSQSTPAAMGLFWPWSFSMLRRSARPGRPTSICRSKRPGLSSAGSSVSARLVAAMTTTPSPVWKPDISLSSAFRVWSRSSEALSSRRLPMASISSMNMTHRPAFRAFLNSSRTRLAPTPTYFSTKSDPASAKNGTPASPASARASRVFPVPGGP